MTPTTGIIAEHLPLRHIHPCLTVDMKHSPFALIVRWDGLEIGIVHDYISAEQMGRDWLQHILTEDATANGDTMLTRCPTTGWTVEAITIGDPVVVGDNTFLWIACQACDWDGHGRTSPHFNSAHPGSHVVALDALEVSPCWTSRYPEKYDA